jgi:hypothetical protein
MRARWLILVGLVVSCWPATARAQIDTTSWFVSPPPVGIWQGATEDGQVRMNLLLAPDGTFRMQTTGSAPVAGRWRWEATRYDSGYLTLSPFGWSGRGAWLEFGGLYRGGDDLVLSTTVGRFPNLTFYRFQFRKQR